MIPLAKGVEGIFIRSNISWPIKVIKFHYLGFLTERTRVLTGKMSQKLEINLKSLIAHCEELVKEEDQRWRLNRYVKSLDSMLKELED